MCCILNFVNGQCYALGLCWFCRSLKKIFVYDIILSSCYLFLSCHLLYVCCKWGKKKFSETLLNRMVELYCIYFLLTTGCMSGKK